MERKSTALFVGHRDCYNLTPEDIKPAIEKAIKLGINTFLIVVLILLGTCTVSSAKSASSQYPHNANITVEIKRLE